MCSKKWNNYILTNSASEGLFPHILINIFEVRKNFLRGDFNLLLFHFEYMFTEHIFFLWHFFFLLIHNILCMSTNIYQCFSIDFFFLTNLNALCTQEVSPVACVENISPLLACFLQCYGIFYVLQWYKIFTQQNLLIFFLWPLGFLSCLERTSSIYDWKKF